MNISLALFVIIFYTIYGFENLESNKFSATLFHNWPILQLEFEGVLGGGDTSDIAIDDVNVTPGPCVAPGKQPVQLWQSYMNYLVICMHYVFIYCENEGHTLTITTS